MDTREVAFDRLPAIPRLFVDYLAGSPALRRLFPCSPSIDALLKHAAEPPAAAPLAEVAAELERQAEELGSDARAAANARALAAPGTVAVVATVLPDLAGGPLAALLEALSACRLAAWLDARGHRAVPVAWVQPRPASASFHWLDADARLQASDREETLRLLDDRPEWDAEFAALLRRCCAEPDAALAVGRLLADVTAGHGLVIVAGGAPGWRRLAAPILERVAAEREEVAAAVASHARRLSEAGYDVAGSIEGGERGAGDCTSALLQAALLPVAAWVGGPSELECLVAALPMYARFDLRPPLLWPSASATLVDARGARILEKYALTLPELFDGPGPLLARRIEEWVPRDPSARFREVASEVERRLEALQSAAEAIGGGAQAQRDAALEEAIAEARSRMIYQIEKLRERAEAARARRREVVERHVAWICRGLVPRGRLQERVVGIAHFLLRHSRALVETLYARIDPEVRVHQLIPIDG